MSDAEMFKIAQRLGALIDVSGGFWRVTVLITPSIECFALGDTLAEALKKAKKGNWGA